MIVRGEIAFLLFPVEQEEMEHPFLQDTQHTSRDNATMLLQHYFSYFKSFHDLNTIVSVARCVPNLGITVVHSIDALL